MDNNVIAAYEKTYPEGSLAVVYYHENGIGVMEIFSPEGENLEHSEFDEIHNEECKKGYLKRGFKEKRI